MLNTFSYSKSNPNNAFDPYGLAYIFIWRPGGTSQYGHAAIMSEKGSYLSHHPDKAGLSPLESEFRTLAEDYAGFRRSPDFVMHIDLPDEQALDDDISSYLQNEELWGFFNNCADSVHDGLNAAGAGLDDLNHDLIDRLSYPTELERQLRGIYWLEKNSVRDRTQ